MKWQRGSKSFGRMRFWRGGIGNGGMGEWSLGEHRRIRGKRGGSFYHNFLSPIGLDMSVASLGDVEGGLRKREGLEEVGEEQNRRLFSDQGKRRKQRGGILGE